MWSRTGDSTVLLRIYFKCCAYQDMVSFRRPSNTEALICNGTQFLLSWSGQGTPDCYCQGPRVVIAGLTQRNPHLFTAYIAHNTIGITPPNLTKITNQTVCHSFNFFNQYNRRSFSHRPYPQCGNQCPSSSCRGQPHRWCSVPSLQVI